MRFKLVALATLLFLIGTAAAETLSSDDEIIAFFKKQAAQRNTSFRFETTSDMFDRLTDNEWDGMSRLEIKGGIIGASANASSNGYSCTFELSEVRYPEEPCSHIEQYDEFSSAVQAYGNQGKSRFSILITGELLEAIKADQGMIAEMEGLSCLRSWSGSIVSSKHYVLLCYENVEFGFEQKLYCKDETDLQLAFNAMAASGTDTFTFVMSDALYSNVTANDFSRLHEIEGGARMISGNLSYSDSLKIVTYSNARFDQRRERFKTIAEVLDYVAACAWNGASVIPIFCETDLYAALTSETGLKPTYVQDIAGNNGILLWSTIESKEKELITYNVKAYYPGMRIAQAYRTGETSGLSPREKEAYELCARIADDCNAAEPWMTAARIQHAICASTEYSTDDSDTDKDTAIGVLLNHRADCDGYSDAFFAIATMAGLNVRYQNGDSDEATSDSGHMWNLIELDGSWRAIDVTWDDNGNDDRYLWFNIGTDRLKARHIYNQETTVLIDAETDWEHRPDSEYFIRNEDEMRAAIRKELNARSKSFYLFFDDNCKHLSDRVLTTIHEFSNVSRIMYYMDEKLLCMRIEEITY